MLQLDIPTMAAPTLVALGILTHFAQKRDTARQAGVRGLPHDQFNRWSSVAHRCSSGARVISVILFAGLLVRFFVIGIQYVLDDLFATGFIFATEWGWGYFAVPLAMATLGILAHMQLTATRGTSTADLPTTVVLESRTAWSFASTAWIVTWVASATTLIITVVSAGLIADVDMEGRHAALTIGAGGLSGTAEFLGWYYGVPILIGVAILAAVTVVALWLSARSPLPANAATGRTVDIVLRTLGARAVLSFGAGAMMVTTGLSWTFISGALRITMSGPLGSLATVYFDTGLAGLSWWLQVAAWLITGLGLAATLLTAVIRRPELREESTPADSLASSPSSDGSSVPHQTMS